MSVCWSTGNGTIYVTGALPGYSAINMVEEGDLVRGVSAWADVVGSAPMWQQVTSGTPIGEVERKRLIFKTDGALYSDVRDAIASHRSEETGEVDKVTLVIERRLNASTPMPLQGDGTGRARLESLTEVLKRDLSKPAEIGRQEAGPVERARRLMEVEEDEDNSGGSWY